jgi:hypothetical protein
MPLFFGGTGVTTDLQGQVTNQITLQAGQVYPLPNNWFEVRTGKYTVIQEYDPILGAFRSPGGGTTVAGMERIKGDGNNYRLANQTGCAVGALLTNGGTGYTSAPTVTASAGGSIWRAIVGGAISTTVTVTNGGSGYTYPPILLIAAPPPGGVQATGYCTLSAGAVSTVTVTDQGAGYASAPIITFQNDPREGVNGVATGVNASAIATLTGAGTVTSVICLDHGTPLTTLPTLAFSGGGGASAAATTIMCWSITAYNISATTAGSGYAAPVIISAYGGFPATSPAYTNVSTQSQLMKGRAGQIIGALSGTALTATGQVVNDGGVYPGAPTFFAYGFIQGANAVQAVFIAPSMGGQTDISVVLTT